MSQCKITAIINQKGGTGKSTTTANLGIGLAKQGKRVLLVDADPQGSLSVSLGFRDQDALTETLATVMSAEMEDVDIPVDHGIIHQGEGVDLLPANIELSGVELGLFNAMSRETVLRTVLNRLRSHYDHILIDCMPSLGLMTINALSAADSVIIPTQPNFLSIKGLNLLLKSVSRVRKQINPKLHIDGILFTMVDSRTNHAQSVIASMRDAVGGNIRVFQTEIPRSVRVAEAGEAGKSIFAYDKNGKVAQAYENLTKEVEQIGKEANRLRTDRLR